MLHIEQQLRDEHYALLLTIAGDSLAVPVTASNQVTNMDCSFASEINPNHDLIFTSQPESTEKPSSSINSVTQSSDDDDDDDNDDATIEKIQKELDEADRRSQKQFTSSSPDSTNMKLHLYDQEESPDLDPKERRKIRKAKKSKAFREKVSKKETQFYTFIRRLLAIIRNLKREKKSAQDELRKLQILNQELENQNKELSNQVFMLMMDNLKAEYTFEDTQSVSLDCSE